ncbi:MAG: S-layer homology domain-containing protein [Clostridia bacterium]
MKRRILSLILAIAMCVTILPGFAVAEEDVELMASLQDSIGLYTERAWDWQEAQFNAMTEEQLAVIANAYANYNAKADEIKDIVYQTAETIVNAGGDEFLATDSMKDLYKWKIMRDIMEGNVDVSVDDPTYELWLENFTEFEKDNDEAISASRPNEALNGLGGYSAQLSQYYIELAMMYNDGAAVTGADADKFNVYAEAALAETGLPAYTVDEAKFKDYLKNDVIELIAESILDVQQIGIEIACNERVRGDAIFDEIDDKTLKSSFLLLGEDLIRYYINIIPELRSALVTLDKRELITKIAQAKGTQILDGSNEVAINAIYDVMSTVSEYVEDLDFMAEPIEKLGAIGFEKDEIETIRTSMIGKAKSIMALLDANHGVELVHTDVYMGRVLLRPAMNSVIEIEAGKKDTIELTFAHDRYPSISEVISGLPSFAQFDVEVVSGTGIDAVAANEIGIINLDATNAEIGDEIVINLYRGYSDEDVDGVDDFVEDEYRYVTTYTVKAVGEPVVYVVDLEEIGDVKLSDKTITVKGETNLEHVTVSIVKGSETIYAVVYTKAELAAGIEINIPDGAVVGDVYEVVVGTDKAEDRVNFTIVDESVVYVVDLEEIGDVKLSDETITVKGETNLEHVTVSIVKGSETIYAVVYTKAELAAGIEINIPDGAVVGDVYEVVVGTDKAEDRVNFTIVDESVVYAVDLEEIGDVKLSDETITVKGTTNLEHVTVSIVKGGETIYAVVYTKAELAAGIEINIPDGAVVGDVYEVVVGTDKAEDRVNFTIIEESEPTEPTEPSEPTEPTVSGKLALAGSSTRYVKVGKTIQITVTPQNVTPADATVLVEWTLADGTILNITEVAVAENGASTATIERLAKGTTEVVATLYVNGEAVDSKTITVKVSSGSTISTPSDKGETVVHKCQWPDIEAHWAHETIDQMTINGYINGYPDGLFRPDQNITRAEFSALVYRILGLEEAEDGVLYDDTVGHWAEGIIATMSLPEGYGMTRGYGDGTFGPNDNITREQAVAIIARAKSAVWVAAEDGAKDVFTDAEDISWWFDGEMDAAVTNGLITGYEDGSYRPQKFTTRAEACTLLARAWPEVLE